MRRRIGLAVLFSCLVMVAYEILLSSRVGVAATAGAQRAEGTNAPPPPRP